MARHDPILPNAGIVAWREYRDRVRGRLFLASTVLLMLMAVGVALTPITISYLDRGRQTVIAVVAAEDGLGGRAASILDSVLNARPSTAGDDWRPPFLIQQAAADEATILLAAESVDGVFDVSRNGDGGLEVVYRSNGIPDSQRTQLVSVAAFGVGVLDWTASLPPDSGIGTFHTPSFEIETVSAPGGGGGQPVDARQLASRTFLGTVFIVLMFISILIYGMWIATGVATEKSSRVMELMISAASPRQMVLGKVAGIGGAGLTQYVAIAVPALVVLAFQDRIAQAVLGPSGTAAVPTGALTIGLLGAYGLFLLLGFVLFAFVYAAVGSFVSRPDDLQTLSLPLSLLAMAGYLAALPILIGGGGSMGRLVSFVPPFSPFAMLARVIVSDVPAVEVLVSVAILVATIAVVALIAVRMYTAGVLLYGQRPGLRAFIAAARRV